MLILLANNPNFIWLIFFFYRYHFVPAEEPDLFAQEERTDASRDDDVHNPRLSADLESKASGIKKLNLYEFKTDKTGVQTSVQYENDVINSFGGVTMLQVRNNKHKKVLERPFQLNNKHKRVIPIDRLEELDVSHYPYTLVIVDSRPGARLFWCSRRSLHLIILMLWLGWWLSIVVVSCSLWRFC